MRRGLEDIPLDSVECTEIRRDIVLCHVLLESCDARSEGRDIVGDTAFLSFRGSGSSELSEALGGRGKRSFGDPVFPSSKTVIFVILEVSGLKDLSSGRSVRGESISLSFLRATSKL